MKDLASLSCPITIPSQIPVLILGAQADPIVSPALIHDNFSGHPLVKIDILKSKGHNLGNQHPTLIHQKIQGFLHA
jgi:pimeloyl-ACP methyl ester carboxylesterase